MATITTWPAISMKLTTDGDPIRDDGVARITMAFSDTGTDGSGRASVEVERTANYRFVFIGGTFDKTGLSLRQGLACL